MKHINMKLKSAFIVLSLILLPVLLLNPATLFAQEFNKSVNKDSLLREILKDIPKDKSKEFLDVYNSGNEQSKEFLLYMYSLPRSSKKEMISNIDLRFKEINLLKSYYEQLVPPNYEVSIEFYTPNNIVNTKESIDLKITHTINKETVVEQEWDMAYHSDKLDKMLHKLNWDYDTLKHIKSLLENAHCISIENGKETTVGFARSGLGKYSYLLFKKDLITQQIHQYNDGCSYIFFKKNIVLQYGGGATGPQCFPDK